MATTTQNKPDVFICHAGEQKLDIADYLYTHLTNIVGLSVFLDEHCLKTGAHARVQMPQSLDAATVVVLLLSPHFIRKKHPMAELRRALDRQKQQQAGTVEAQPQQQFLCPVFFSISVEECCSSGFRQLYEQQPWESFHLQEPKPPADVLDAYADDIAELCTITGLRQDQARFYQGQLASMAVDSVISCLKQAGRLAPGYSLGKPQCHVPANTRRLIGRERELQQVLMGLEGNTRCVVISGGPGEGKSALAQAAVWQLREQGELPGGAHCVNLAGCLEADKPNGQGSAHRRHVVDIMGDLLASALLKHQAGALSQQRRGWAAVEECLNRKLHHGRMLVLLENAQDAHGCQNTAQELKKALQKLCDFPGVQVLINSRSLLAFEGAIHVHLAPLGQRAAAELLRDRSGATTWDSSAAASLSQMCGRNALCLCIVGSFIASGRCTMQAAVAAGSVLSVEQGAREGGVRDDEHVVSITSWLLRYLSPAEQRALSRLWMFRGGFGLEAATIMLGTDAPTPVLQVLRSLSAAGQRALSSLPLFSSAFRPEAANAMLGTEEPTPVLRLLLDLQCASCLQVLPSSDADGSVRFGVHALVSEVFQGQFSKLSSPAQHAILRGFGKVMIGHAGQLKIVLTGRQWSEATALLADQVLNLQQLCLLLNAPGLASWASGEDILNSLNDLGHCESQLGYYACAIELLRRVLGIMQQVLGPEHPSTLSSMNNLANALQGMGQHAEAAKLHQKVLDKRQQVLKANDLDTLSSMNNLATALQDMRQHSEAAELHQRVLEMRQEVLGDRNPYTLNSMNNLAMALQGLGQHAEAAELHRKVAEMRQQVLGDMDPDTLSSRNNLAIALQDMGQHTEAAELHRYVLKGRQQKLGDRHPDTLSSMNNLANALQDSGQQAEAAEVHRTAVKMRRKVLGDKHPDTLSSMTNLANALMQMGQCSEAEELHRKVLKRKRQVLAMFFNRLTLARKLQANWS